jgi:hypothetical protein
MSAKESASLIKKTLPSKEMTSRVREFPECQFVNSEAAIPKPTADQLKSGYAESPRVGSEIDGGDAITKHV